MHPISDLMHRERISNGFKGPQVKALDRVGGIVYYCGTIPDIKIFFLIETIVVWVYSISTSLGTRNCERHFFIWGYVICDQFDLPESW